MLTLVLLLAATVAAMLMLGKCSHRQASPLFPPAGTYPPKSGGDTLDVAIEISPVGYNISGDTVCGLDYELLRAMAAAHGRAVKFHPFSPLEWALKGLDNGSFDLLVSSLQSTLSLKNRIPLTRSVYLDRQVMVQRSDASNFISSPQDLASDSVWISAGSPSRDRIVNLAAEIGDTIYIIDDIALTPEHLVMLTASGKIPRAIAPEGVAKALQGKFPVLDISIPVSFNQFQVWGVSARRHDLLPLINSWIDSFVTTESYFEITDRYHALPCN